jgi:hypothetical protein
MDNNTDITSVDNIPVNNTLPSNDNKTNQTNKEAYHLEQAIMNSIARFNAINNTGLGMNQSLGLRSNPFENPDIRTDKIKDILRKISTKPNLGSYISQSFDDAARAQKNSVIQGFNNLFGFGKGGKKSRRRRRSGKRTRKNH